MYCQKCGSEVSPGEKFCSKCGAPIEYDAQPTAQTQQPTAQTQRPKAQAPGKQTITLTIPRQLRSPLGIMYAVAALLHLLQLIFWNVNTYSYGSKASRTTAYVLKSSGSSLSFATVFFIILTTVSILLCVAPLLQNTVGKPRKMIVPLASCAWTFIWTIVALNSDFWISFSFFGWLFAIITVLTILLEVFILLLSNKILTLSANLT